MPGTKEIRSKIASVKSTQKITKAMQMVATSKMRRAQERMKQARPYAQKMRNVIGHLTEANPDYRHPFLVTTREPRAIGIIVISTDRGLAFELLAYLRNHGIGWSIVQPEFVKHLESQGRGPRHTARQIVKIRNHMRPWLNH